MSIIKKAEINWQDNIPVNDMFHDPYFSLENGEAESEYVFLKHNNLPNAFLKRSTFTIAETGFGTGLNFFVTAKLWQKYHQPDAHLYYFSVEKHPISHVDLYKIYKTWPQYQLISQTLLEQYPGAVPGFHHIQFKDLNITLILMIGDVADVLRKMLTKADAWYLDGFAPSKNADMWSTEVFELVSALSHQGTSFATFTAAGFVRRNLQVAGFNVKKSAGFGKKREMLYGCVEQPGSSQNLPPWFSLTSIGKTQNQKQKKYVAIIGGGIAGLTCAKALAEKHIDCIIVESGSELAIGASGNPAGIVLPKINTDVDAISQYYMSCFESAITCYLELQQDFPDLQWRQSGVLQLLSKEKLDKYASLNLPESLLRIVDDKEASELAGLEINQSALYFPQAGSINPRQLCSVIADSCGDYLKTIFNTSVKNIAKYNDQWVLKNGNGAEICRSDVVIVANGHVATELLQTNVFTLEPSRGQLSYVPVSEKSKLLKSSVCAEGYIIPPTNDMHVVGASYGGKSVEPSLPEHIANINQVNKFLVDIFPTQENSYEGRVSFRAVTQDHLPLVGPVINEHFYRQCYHNLHEGKPQKSYQKAEYIDGLFVSAGHGSRGLVTCVNSARYLAALITGSDLAESADNVAMVHPGRFLIRAFRRNKPL